MHLSPKELELAAISISIAAGCIPCTHFHIAEAEKLGAESDAIAHAIQTGANVADVALMRVWQIFDDQIDHGFRENEQLFEVRQSLLGAIGAAVARNNVEQLRSFVKGAQSKAVSDSEIMEIIGLASRIKEKATSHLERIIDKLDADATIARKAANLCT